MGKIEREEAVSVFIIIRRGLFLFRKRSRIKKFSLADDAYLDLRLKRVYFEIYGFFFKENFIFNFNGFFCPNALKGSRRELRLRRPIFSTFPGRAPYEVVKY